MFSICRYESEQLCLEDMIEVGASTADPPTASDPIWFFTAFNSASESSKILKVYKNSDQA